MRAPWFFVVALASTACAPGAASPPRTMALAPPMAPEVARAELPKSLDVAAIDAWIAAEVKARGIVGASVVLVDHGKVILAKGYGRKSIAAPGDVTADTAFAIGSVTKQITCASLLLLAEKGRVSLDDRVAKYFPELTRARDITLDDALAHLSGYPDYYPLDFVDARMTKATTPDALLRQYAQRPLDFEPRTRWSYSNTGYVLAGRVVEKVSGEPFGAFVAKRIFQPLRMTSSSFDRTTLTDVATGHTAFALGDPELAPPEADGWAYAAGAAYASARDLATWDLALADEKVVNAASLARMLAPHALTDGTPTGYACGLQMGHRGSETVFAHSGAVNGFAAYNALVPRTRSAVVVLTNGDFGSPGAIHGDLLTLLTSHEGARKPPTVSGPPARDAAAALLRQMQKGEVDRSTLADEFGLYMSEARVHAAAPRLAALGEPQKIEVQNISERGGAETATIDFTFASARVRASLHRSPDGKIQQFLLSRR